MIKLICIAQNQKNNYIVNYKIDDLQHEFYPARWPSVLKELHATGCTFKPTDYVDVNPPVIRRRGRVRIVIRSKRKRLINFLSMDDNSIMEFGKHKGEKLANVPDSYFKFMYEQGFLYGDLKRYVEENLDSINPSK